MNKGTLQQTQQALISICSELEQVNDQRNWQAFELMLSSSVVELAKKTAKPETKTVTGTISNV
jgi:hypothetical protein